MNTIGKTNIESLNRIESFSEIYNSIKKSHENLKSLNSNIHKKHSHEKHNSPKKTS